MPYSIYEPAPRHTTTMSYGRGGAGNRTHPLPPSSLKSSNTTTTTQHQDNSTFSTGRGGVGNMHSTEERRMFSFDEELAKQGKATASPIYHIGRGGQGNAVHEGRRDSDASSSGSNDGKRGSLEWVRGLARTSKP